MATIEDVARKAIANTAASSSMGLPLVLSWVEQRYREVSNRTHLRSLRNEGELVYPAPIISVGTVAVTTGSNKVVGTSTSFTRGLIGWYFRFNTNWYLINDVQGQTLYLNSPYVESTASLAGYYIVQRFTPTAPNVQWIGVVTHPRLFRRLLERTMNWLDHREAARILVAAFPTVWAEGPAYHGTLFTTGNAGSGVTNTLVSDRRKTLEIYPYSTQQELFRYTWWEVLPPVRLETLLPPEVDPYMLYEGVKADIYEYRREMALAKTPPDAQSAMVYQRAMEQAQGRWEQVLQQLVVKDMLALDEDVELWSDFGDSSSTDIDSQYDNMISRLGLITVQ